MTDPLYVQSDEPMRIAGFLSGSGTNIRRVLERQNELSDTLFKVVVLFSDTAESNAVQIGKEYDLPIVIRDIRSFYKTRNKKRSDLSVRAEFDAETVKALKPYDAQVAAFGGYMSIASEVLVNAFIGINVHPADLTVTKDGSRVYTGAHAVQKAIDAGPILIRSKPVQIDRTKSASDHQDLLKKEGDWKIFPKTIEYLAQGKFSIDEKMAYFDGIPIPNGIIMGEESDIYNQSFEE